MFSLGDNGIQDIELERFSVPGLLFRIAETQCLQAGMEEGPGAWVQDGH